MSALPQTKDLILDKQGSVLTLWLNRPEAKNALSAEMVDELHAVLDAAAADPTLRTLILRGKGGIFCAGADIKGFKSGAQGGEPNEDDVARGNRTFGDLMIKLNEQPQAVIMLVEGAAIGGGLGLPQARRLMLTGARFKGEEAVQYGIGHILAEDSADMEAKCAEVLAQIALCAPGANAVTKSIVFEATRRPRSEALDFAARGFAKCMLSDEGREGVAAFVEKRKPTWASE